MSDVTNELCATEGRLGREMLGLALAKDIGDVSRDVLNTGKDLARDICDTSRDVLDTGKDLSEDICEVSRDVLNTGKDLSKDICDVSRDVLMTGKDLAEDICGASRVVTAEARALGMQSAAGFRDAEVRMLTGFKDQIIEAKNTQHAMDVAFKNVQIQNEHLAAKAAKERAELHYDLREKVTSDGQQTRELLNSIERQRLERENQSLRDELLAYRFKYPVAARV